MTSTNPKDDKFSLGNILLRKGFIDEHQLDEALRLQRLTGVQLGRAIVDHMKVIEEDDLAQALAMQDLERVDGEGAEGAIYRTHAAAGMTKLATQQSAKARNAIGAVAQAALDIRKNFSGGS